MQVKLSIKVYTVSRCTTPYTVSRGTTLYTVSRGTTLYTVSKGTTLYTVSRGTTLYTVSRGTTPPILNFGTRWRWGSASCPGHLTSAEKLAESTEQKAAQHAQLVFYVLQERKVSLLIEHRIVLYLVLYQTDICNNTGNVGINVTLRRLGVTIVAVEKQ